MYVTYDLKNHDYIDIVEMSISSFKNYNKILLVYEISFKYFEPFWIPYLKDQPLRLDKLALFEYRFSTPFLTRKIENNQKMKTDVHKYNVSSFQIHLI